MIGRSGQHAILPLAAADLLACAVSRSAASGRRDLVYRPAHGALVY